MEVKFGKMPCDVQRFATSMVVLDKEQKSRIKALGFEGMLDIKSVKLREYLLYSILENYDATEEKVKFGSGHNISICPSDVDVIFGLADRGSLVQLDANFGMENIPENYKAAMDGDGFSINKLELILWKAAPHEDFDRTFVLYLLGTFLAPVSRDHIPYSYYSLVQDATKIKEINWNEFTLRVLKESLATMKEGLGSNRWPSGNLYLLQLIYWEKIRPCYSLFLFSARTPPLVKYWDEELAVKRDIYVISYGLAPTTMVVDDLKKEPTLDQLQNGMSTPTSMAGNYSDEVTRRLTYLETSMKLVMNKDKTLVRCLEPDFDDQYDASKTGSSARKLGAKLGAHKRKKNN